MEAQDGTNHKQLEKACPNQQHLPEVQPATPQVKKSSVAAAIAASWAKAKVIVTAPPTLQHQATSTVHTMSPPKHALSPSLSTGSVSGRVTPTSPSVPSHSRVSSTHPSRIPLLMAQKRTPTMPVNQSAAIWKLAAAFRDSPMQQGTPSLMTDILRQMMARTDGTWWRRCMAYTYHCHLFCFPWLNSSHSVQLAQSPFCFKWN